MLRAGGLCLVAVMVPLALGGYWDGEAQTFTAPAAAAPRSPAPLAVIFWSGDMGLRVGFGSDLPERFARRGVPVLAVSSPALFGTGRDRAFAQAAVADSLRRAIRQSGARKVAVVGFSFGADLLAATIGGLEPDLRRTIASLVLVGPGRDVSFHANPFGIFYGGPSAVAPARMVESLRGLPLSCIFATAEDESLCRDGALAGARLVPVDDGHLMLAHRREVTDAVIAAALNPPRPLP